MRWTGRSALVLATLAVAATLAGVARGEEADRSWEARNRQRARAGLLPRRPPPRATRKGIVAAAPPTAVPPAGATASRTASSTSRRGTTEEPRAVTRSFSPAAPLAGPAHAPGLLSRRWLASGEQVHRVVDARGRISERRLDARGLVVEAHVVGDAASLPVVAQRRGPGGDVVQVRRDDSGALVALTRDGGGHLVGARVLPVTEAGAL